MKLMDEIWLGPRRPIDYTVKREQEDKFVWALRMIETLSAEMAEQRRKRRLFNSGIKSEAYETVAPKVSAVNDQIGPNGQKFFVEPNQVKTKFSILKGLYQVWDKLIDQSGFGVDQATGVVIASSSVWSEYFRHLRERVSHTLRDLVRQLIWLLTLEHAKWLRTKPLPCPDLCIRIRSDSIASVEYAQGLTVAAIGGSILGESIGEVENTIEYIAESWTTRDSHISLNLNAYIGD